ncbi:gluconolaconase [Paucibacter sp. PLA-PC-4]|uniref:gluconolaconase n=1 Tax=Paucibacter sp. PLA-PC-4 TaxID=2993655 RepID=UPI0022494E58|nr:gluconolaconase [Paucibacter sp. PLA-PC-4]MCX2860546.1 gluconolaconase [Paucibacter sp. PLA-PC-4]
MRALPYAMPMMRRPVLLSALLLGAAVIALLVTRPGLQLIAPPTAGAPQGPTPTVIGWRGQLQPCAGDGVEGWRDGPAIESRFADPYGLAVDAQGRIYVADGGTSNRIRVLTAEGQVLTLAGSGAEGWRDGSAAEAAFHTPSGLALDAAGNLYVADTGNHRIRKITPEGQVSTLAGDGQPGHRDGPADQARFNGPLGLAVDGQGRVLVADSYNDRIRLISAEGQVLTLAGGELPGERDGVGAEARFDTPTALVINSDGHALVADAGNHAIRRVALDGTVTTVARAAPDDEQALLRRPLSLALSHDGHLYIGVQARGRVLQLTPDGQLHQITAGDRLARPTGLALAADGSLKVADAASYRLHRLAAVAPGQSQKALGELGPSAQQPLPQTAGRWPLRPQQGPHEVVGVLGEVRGGRNNKGAGTMEPRHHLHGGLDIAGPVGAEVLAMADAKVTSPLASWGYGELSEGLALGPLAYIHLRVGRRADGRPLDPQRFVPLRDEQGRPERMRLRRGTRFEAGEVLGTLNGMAHVHLSLGAPGHQGNALALRFKDFSDLRPPHIASVELFDAAGSPLSARAKADLLLPSGPPGVSVVVEAWDQVDGNKPSRRLGLHSLAYQLLDEAGRPLPGFEQPRRQIGFEQIPGGDVDEDRMTQIAYAAGSGVTVHGQASTRFRYQLMNQVDLGRVAEGRLTLPAPGRYRLRVLARDWAGNEAVSELRLQQQAH